MTQTCSQAVTLASQLAENRYLRRRQNLSRSELANIVQHVLDDCAAWTAGQEDRLTACCQYLRDVCIGFAIPVAEGAYALYALRDALPTVSANDRCSPLFLDRVALQLMRGY